MRIKLMHISLLVLIIVAFICCKTTKKVTKWQVPDDEYAFVEYYQTNEGVALEGNPPPGRRIDGPTYSFNPETGELHSYLFNNFDKDSIKVILGRGLVLRGTEGGGLHNRLIASGKIPLTEDKITINSISHDGISISWSGESINLSAGDVLINKYSSIDTLYMPEGKVVIENSTTYTIKYFGLLKKENLHLQ